MNGFCTIKEAAEILKMSTCTIYKLAQQGKIPAVKIGGSWRINVSAIKAGTEQKEK